MSVELVKRKWVYVQPPKDYEMGPCPCGNFDLQWSEFQGHLWCEKCQKDFIPENAGIFDGPILAQVAQLCGMSFDRFNLETQQVERFEDYIEKKE